MKFGRSNEPIEQIDFSLKPLKFLHKGKSTQDSTKKMNIYFGAPKWGIKEWVGKIYPEKTAQKNYLNEYSKQFNAIEMNSMYYRLPSLESVDKWKSQVSEDFKFCPKVPQGISHYGGLKDLGKIKDLKLVLNAFGSNLGITFLQLHESFAPKNEATLKFFLDQMKDFDIAVELRHHDWFEQEELFKWLAARDISTVITDASGRRDVAHMIITSENVMVRWLGNNLHKTDYKRIDDWVVKISELMNNGITNLYFFPHEPNDILCPEITSHFIKKINEDLDYVISDLRFFNQPSLISTGPT